MAWVRSEYAGELAVISAWVSALLPWSLSYLSPGGFSVVTVRWAFFRFQFLFGLDLGGAERPFLLVTSAPSYPGNPLVRQAYVVWQVGAAVLALALLFSVVYYLREEQVEAGPVDPVRVMGGLLLGAGLLLAGSTAMLVWKLAGLTLPIGALFVPAFGAILLSVDHETDRGEVSDRTSGEHSEP